jgi:hypothetical protein
MRALGRLAVGLAALCALTAAERAAFAQADPIGRKEAKIVSAAGEHHLPVRGGEPAAQMAAETGLTIADTLVFSIWWRQRI